MSALRHVAVDTSIAVPLVVADHPDHAAIVEWAQDKALSLSGHALIETYAVLTRLPGSLRATGDQAAALIEENFAPSVQPTSETFTSLPRRCAHEGIAGGAVYDALVGAAAADNDLVLATRDARARSTYRAVGVATEVPTHR